MMATLPKTKTLALSLDAGWLTVWFNQPERRNPLTDEAVEDLAARIWSRFGFSAFQILLHTG